MRYRYKEPPEISELKELEDLLGVWGKLSPGYHQTKFIQLTCGQDFEGHGIASETWELYWKLTLPFIKHHWRSTTGWRVGTVDAPISFHGRTAQKVIQQAIDFLKQCPKPEELPRNTI